MAGPADGGATGGSVRDPGGRVVVHRGLGEQDPTIRSVPDTYLAGWLKTASSCASSVLFQQLLAEVVDAHHRELPGRAGVLEAVVSPAQQGGVEQVRRSAPAPFEYVVCITT